MALFSVEFMLEIEANTHDDAASQALLEIKSSTEPLNVDVYSDPDADGRAWRRIAVEPLKAARSETDAGE